MIYAPVKFKMLAGFAGYTEILLTNVQRIYRHFTNQRSKAKFYLFLIIKKIVS